MSFNDYQLAIERLKEFDNFVAGSGTSEEYLNSVEQMLGVKFSPMHRDFLLNYGYIRISPFAVIGLDETNSAELPLLADVLRLTIEDREVRNLPLEWIPVTLYNGGCFVYLDYSDMIGEEPKAKLKFYNGIIYYPVDDNYATDFAGFLLKFEQKIKSQSQS